MHHRLRLSNRQTIRLSAYLFIAVCALLALAGFASRPPQASSPTGSSVAGALPTATPLAATPGPRLTALLPTATPFPTSTPPSWPALAGNAVLPAPLYFSDGYISRIERDGKTRNRIVLDWWDQSDDVSPVDGTVVLAGQGRLWLSNPGSTWPTLLLVGLPNPEATDDCYNIRDPVWSPDGRYIAYADGGIRVWDMALAKRIDLAEIPVQDEEYTVPWTYYGICYEEPRWSPTGDAILFFEHGEDYRSLRLVTLSDKQVREVPSRWGIEHKDIAWSADGKALFFDCQSNCPSEIQDESSYVRLTLADMQVHPFVSQDGFVDLEYPFQASDSRMLYFEGSSLMEGVITQDNFETRVLQRNAFPSGVDEAAWHKSGKYVAFLIDKDENPTIAVLRVDTGEIFTVLRERDLSGPLRWGEQ